MLFRIALIILKYLGLNFGIYSLSYHSTVTGYTSITGKECKISNLRINTMNYYIYVDINNNIVKLKCTKKDYESVSINEDIAYKISYKMSTMFPNKGKLLSVNFGDMIDYR